MGTIGYVITIQESSGRFGVWMQIVGVALSWLVAGLAFTRLLYEGLFPRVLWLARPLPVVGVALVIALIGLFVWHGIQNRHPQISTSIFLPLFLNVFYLFDSQVDLERSRIIFGFSVWLTAVFITNHLIQSRSWRWVGILFAVVLLLPLYLLSMPHTVGRADTFEFQVVAPQLGIAHPTGYPLYLLLGKLWTLLLPLGSLAWRLNMGTAVYALIAVSLVFLTAFHWLKLPIPALLGAVALGATPVFWSQAVEAEVYSLHALFTALALFLMLRLLVDFDPQIRSRQGQSVSQIKPQSTSSLLHSPRVKSCTRTTLVLAFIIGLGLTNHLTTVFLIPPAALTILLACWPQLRQHGARANLFFLLKVAFAFLIPLVLYLYLPLRWTAVNHEPMGFGRFVEWVIGGRFQNALQLMAWLRDPLRYSVVGRLFLGNWGWLNLLIIAFGAVFAFWRNWRVAVVLLLTWLGFTFYALNYYVPDLAVFLTAAHVVMAIWWAAGIVGLLAISGALWNSDWPIWSENSLFLLAALPVLLMTVTNWVAVDRSDTDGLTTWGQAVLELPLAQDAAILADSEKIAPLYYLQQTEGMRPDLEIMVLPDEAAYRAELDTRLAAGQSVYLARFLPGLEGIYHLRSVGPLLEVSNEPLLTLPDTAVSTTIKFDTIQLLGYELELEAAADPNATAVTFYWQTPQPVDETLYVYLRWANQPPTNPAGQHPAGNYYPTVAWHAGEIVADYHLLLRPVLTETQELDLQVALALPFTTSDDLVWQTVTAVTLPPTTDYLALTTLRIQNGRWLLSGADYPAQVRPQTPLPVIWSGFGDATKVELELVPVGKDLVGAEFDGFMGEKRPFTYPAEAATNVENGKYQLIARDSHSGTVCGWMRRSTDGCRLGTVVVSGVPLSEDAINFEDKIALLDVDLPEKQLQPGAQFPVNLTWQSLAPIAEDYTVFIQILDPNDQIIGQVDAWPLQGTHPTSQWKPGETINDPYLVQISGDLPPGPYRLQIGWYLLANLRRLPVLDAKSVPIDDKFIIPDLK